MDCNARTGRWAGEGYGLYRTLRNRPQSTNPQQTHERFYVSFVRHVYGPFVAQQTLHRLAGRA